MKFELLRHNRFDLVLINDENNRQTDVITGY